MFDYTRAAGRKIQQDIDKIYLGLNIVTQLLSIFYLVYILLFGTGLLAVRICLLALSASYFLFFCIATTYDMRKELKRKARLTYQWSKRLIKIVNLGVIIYGFATAEHTTFSLMLIAFSILSWALDLVIGVISFVLTSWLQLFFTGVETDMEEFKKTLTAPFTATGNFFKRMAGREVDEEEKTAPTANQTLLYKMVGQERQRRREEKTQTRLDRKLEKLNKRMENKQKKEEKKAKKRAQRNPAPSISDESALSKDE